MPPLLPVKMPRRLDQLSRFAVVVGLALFILPALAGVQPPPESPVIRKFRLPEKPVWLTELSFGVKEGYDDNVFLSGVNSNHMPKTYAVPPGSAVALKNRASWVTRISPKIALNLAPLLGDQKLLQTLSLAYAPEFAVFFNQDSENNDAHRFAAAIKGGTGSLAFNLDTSFVYVDGNSIAPTYPGGFASAFSTAAPRERRKQIQERAVVSLQYNWDRWFVRPTASLLYYDLMTQLIDVPGYQNYADRYDVNGGVDLGYRVTPDLAATIGYRYGHQYQEQFSFTKYSSPSDYQRILLGVEGRPWKWLDLKIQAGPDFRDYAPDTADHITPVDNKNFVTYYADASVTASLTSRDTVAIKYKQWQWVSSTGKVPYFDSGYEVTYRRLLTDKLLLELGGRLLTADYNGGNLPACERDDWQYSVSAGLTYTINSHASLNASYVMDLARNAQEDIPNPQTREYNRQLFSLGVVLAF